MHDYNIALLIFKIILTRTNCKSQIRLCGWIVWNSNEFQLHEPILTSNDVSWIFISTNNIHGESTKQSIFRLCSHDAGTARKRHEKVTFSLSVHTMPVRNCTIPSLLPSQNNAGF